MKYWTKAQELLSFHGWQEQAEPQLVVLSVGYYLEICITLEVWKMHVTIETERVEAKGIRSAPAMSNMFYQLLPKIHPHVGFGWGQELVLVFIMGGEWVISIDWTFQSVWLLMSALTIPMLVFAWLEHLVVRVLWFMSFFPCQAKWRHQVFDKRRQQCCWWQRTVQTRATLAGEKRCCWESKRVSEVI